MHRRSFVQSDEFDELVDILIAVFILYLEREVREFRSDAVNATLCKYTFDEGLPPSIDNTEFMPAEFLFVLWIEAILLSEGLNKLNTVLELLILGIAPE